MSTLRDRKKARTRETISRVALRLFAERGFANVTIAEVAAAAEVGERTVFRYFPDKEELLFGENDAFAAALAGALAARPDDEPPVAAVLRAAGEVAALLDGRRDELAERLEVIHASPALQARECAKHAGFEAVLAGGLQARGVDPGPARMLARVGIACYDTAVERWLRDADPSEPGLAAHMRAGMAELKELLAGG